MAAYAKNITVQWYWPFVYYTELHRRVQRASRTKILVVQGLLIQRRRNNSLPPVWGSPWRKPRAAPGIALCCGSWRAIDLAPAH